MPSSSLRKHQIQQSARVANNQFNQDREEQTEMHETQMATLSSPQEMTKNSPQPELAMMTNVNVLDLQKEYIDDNNKIYSKDNTVYMYTSTANHSTSLQHDGEDDIKDDQHHSLIQSAQQPDESQILDEQQHIITDNHSEQLLTKLAISDDHILRLVGPNGESQQIISREIIDGEHHILTRNENGEHTITRIVSADNHGLLSSSDNAIYTTDSTSQQQHLNQHKIITTSPSGSSRHSHQTHHHQQQQQQHHQQHHPADQLHEPHHVIYTTSTDDNDHTLSASSILEQYDDSNEHAANLQVKHREVHHSYVRSSGEVLHRVHSNGTHPDDKHQKHQIIYTHHGGTKDEDDDEIFPGDHHKASSTSASATANAMYTSGGGSDEKAPPLDLIYEDGVGKTVIYTTTGDNKSLELYAGNDLSMLSEGQVIVQGGLQYSTQQLHGQTVFVVSDAALVNGDLGAQIHQR